MNDQFLKPGEHRDAVYAKHPVVRNAVKIVTGPVREAEEVTRGAILHRDPGTYFLAEPRVGKTTTIEMIKSVMPQTFPGVPVFDCNAKSHCTRSEKTFFGELLYELGQSPAVGSPAAYRRAVALDRLIGDARTAKSDRIVLLIDEGQSWNEFEYELLRDLINDLRKAGVVCTTIIFAHPNLELHVKRDLLRKGRTDLTGRFLVSRHTFRGLANKAELADAFGAYDNPRRHQFPSGSELCYSQFFRPGAFGQGWRLAAEVDIAWSIFAAASKSSERSLVSLGMQWVSGAIRNFLFAIDESVRLPTAEIWNDSIRAASYNAMY